MKTIPLRNRHGETIAEAIVDDEDYEDLAQHRWSLQRDSYGTCYALRMLKVSERQPGFPIKTYMHRVILRAPIGMEVDHINHNGLDNRRRNIRICTGINNRRNQRSRKQSTSKFLGVSWANSRQGWTAHIQSATGKPQNLGYWDSEEHAALAYDRAAEVLFGQFANLNFPDRQDAPPPPRQRKLSRSGWSRKLNSR